MKKGYIALISSIIISMLMLMISLTLSFTGFFSRINILNAEFKEISLRLAEACADMALLKLSENQSYQGNENIAINDKQCSILIIEAAGDEKIIKTKANFQKAVTNLKIKVNNADLSVISWEELAKF